MANARQRGKYCTLAGNLFHHKIHCVSSFDHRSHFHLELEAVKEAGGNARRLAEGPQGASGLVAFNKHDSALNCWTNQMSF